MKRPMVKVRVEYEDGNHWFELYTEGHAKAGLAFVEIEEDEWRAWRTHCIGSRLWQNRLLELGNWQYEKDHPE